MSMQPSGSGVFFVGRFLTTNSISLTYMALVRFFFFISPVAVLYLSRCNIVIYSKKYIFGLHPHSQHRAPKTLGIS